MPCGERSMLSSTMNNDKETITDKNNVDCFLQDQQTISGKCKKSVGGSSKDPIAKNGEKKIFSRELETYCDEETDEKLKIVNGNDSIKVEIIKRRVDDESDSIEGTSLINDNDRQIVQKSQISRRTNSFDSGSKHLENSGGFQKRVVFTLLGCFSFFNLYAMRFNLSVAMVDMAQQPSESDYLNGTAEACVELIETNLNDNSTETAHLAEFDWDIKLQQLALGSFYFGYVVAQIPFGIIAEKYHAKHCFGIGILLTAILTLLTPVAARYSVTALIVLRIIQGISQGGSCPAINTLIGRWSPVLERSRISTIIFNGGHVGTVISFALSGVLCDSNFLGGWPSVFYVFGTLGCIAFILWTFFVSESPDVHPHITKAELALIHKDQVITKKKTDIPWKPILTSIPLWGLVITQMGFVWGYYTLLIETPIYLNNALHFDLKKNGFLSSLPIIISVIMGFIASIIADKLRESGKFHITTIRKIINSVGLYGSGLCLLVVAFAGCSPTAIIIFLCIGMGLMGMPYSVLMVTYVDMSPDFCGTLMAISMTTANSTGFLVPLFAGWILHEENTLKNWGIIFITAFTINVICGTVYNVFCSSENQNWHSSKEKPKALPSKDETDFQLMTST